MRVWLFQSVPNVYDLAKKVKTGRKTYWHGRFEGTEEMREGDTVFFWQAGKNARIHSLGKLITRPQRWQSKTRVRVEYTRILSPPILKSELKKHSILRNLGILHFWRMGTGFGVSNNEWTALQRLIRRNQPEPDWNTNEIRATVKDYFSMLERERRGELYNKTEHRRSLMARLNNRSEGAVELKHQNISAVLVEAGMPSIDGYKPRGNFQHALKDEVLRYLNAHRMFIRISKTRKKLASSKSQNRDNKTRYIHVEPPVFDPHKTRAQTSFRIPSPKKIDFLLRESQNRKMAKNGEKFTLDWERQRLRKAGRPDLARRVEWTSDEVGDGTGYDIKSFEVSGKPRFIEVKTTRSGKNTPFLISQNELNFAKSNSRQYRLYRVFNFKVDEVQFYVLEGALDNNCLLVPKIFEARF